MPPRFTKNKFVKVSRKVSGYDSKCCLAHALPTGCTGQSPGGAPTAADAPAMNCHTEIPLKNCFFVNRAGGAWDLDAPLAVSRLHAWKETMLLRGCCTDDSCNFHAMSYASAKASQPFDADARLYTPQPAHPVTTTEITRGSRRGPTWRSTGAPSRPDHSHPGHTRGGLSRDK